MTPDPAEELALWRYHLIAEALSPKLSGTERGVIVRRIAAEEHAGVDGQPRWVSRNTLDRWIVRYRQQGLAGLRDRPRSDRGSSKRLPELIEEAVQLRLEQPARSAAHIAEMLSARHSVQLSDRTVREQLQKRGLARNELLGDKKSWGRFEATEPNQRWIADVLVGPFVPFPKAPGSRRARLFLIVDDHSRLLVHGRWCPWEKLRSGQEVLRQAIERRGLPEQLYVDNGAAFAGKELGRSCAVLGIRLIHSRPYAPQGRGKQERLNRVIRERFLLEAEQVGIASFIELNDRFWAWSERYLNLRTHSQTGESPMERFCRGQHRQADPERVRQAFLWSEPRRVSKTGTVHFQGNEYQTDPVLCSRQVELRYRPEDLAHIEVWFDKRQFGHLTPLIIARHVHPQAAAPPTPLAEPTGVDYLGQVLAEHEALETGSISFSHLLSNEDPS